MNMFEFMSWHTFFYNKITPWPDVIRRGINVFVAIGTCAWSYKIYYCRVNAQSEPSQIFPQRTEITDLNFFKKWLYQLTIWYRAPRANVKQSGWCILSFLYRSTTLLKSLCLYRRSDTKRQHVAVLKTKEQSCKAKDINLN